MALLSIAHRGGAALFPENTLAAFRNALALGCDGAELDVQLSRDGEVIVFHDYWLKPEICRDANGGWLNPPTPFVKDLTLAELRSFDIGRADPASAYARTHPLLQPVDGERIPTLDEVVECAKNLAKPFCLFVELKTSRLDRSISADPKQLAEATLQVLRAHDYLDRAVLVGFDWSGLLEAKRLQRDVECWFSTQPQSWFGKAIGAIEAAGAEGWFPMYRDATRDAVGKAHSLGLKVGAWTVDDPADMRRLIALGVDAICTDRPDLLCGIANFH